MNIRPTRTFIRCLYFLGASFLILVSCSKDNDILLDAVLKKDENPIVEEENTTTEEDQDDVVSDVDTTPEETDNFESRITIFPAMNDAYE